MEWWHEALALGIVGVAGFLWKSLIANKFDILFDLIDKNHKETLLNLKDKTNIDLCNERHRRIDNDLNNMGNMIREQRK